MLEIDDDENGWMDGSSGLQYTRLRMCLLLKYKEWLNIYIKQTLIVMYPGIFSSGGVD